MTEKHKIFLQVFEKLGTPLIAAVNEVNARSVAAGQAVKSSDKEDAEKLAQLLTAVTRVSVELADKVDFSPADADKDDLRLGLATVVAPLVASLYQMSAKVPAAGETQKFAEAFQALGSYADNFLSLKEASGRLQQMEQGQFFVDDDQIRLQVLNILIPIVNSVIAFPFGQPPAKLIRKVTDRLLEESDNLQTHILPDLSGGEKSHARLSLLRGLVVIYAQCHFAEMARIISQQNEQREENGLEPVWKAFDERIDMLKVIAAAVSEQPLPAGDEQTAYQPAAQPPAKPVSITPPQPEEGAAIPPVSPQPPKEAAKPASGAPANPMAFFLNKNNSETSDEGNA